jgi:16S rRNA (guanine1207-N2)-methyltransferase
MHDGAGVAGRRDRLALAFEAGDLPLPESGPILVIGAEPSALYARVGSGRFRCEQPFRPTHDRLAAEGLAAGPRLVDETGAAMAIVPVPRQRAEALGRLARALALVPPGGTVLLDGAKTDGVDALIRQVAAVLPLAGRLAKAHGRLAWFTRPEALPEAVGVWAEAAALRPNDDGFVTAPGMFSPDHADPGSQRLAAQFDARLSGRVADLGAGWGWLAARALAGCPGITLLDLYEADARALDAARLNVPDPRAAFHWVDVARIARPQPAYDWVIANPPFHRGRAAEPGLGVAFIDAAARILKPTGSLLLVANRQLPYEAALARRFRDHTTLSEDAAYKVIAAERPVR